MYIDNLLLYILKIQDSGVGISFLIVKTKTSKICIKNSAKYKQMCYNS